MPAKKQRTMSDDHKEALAKGRVQGNAVRNYLEALEAHAPKRGRKRTPESIEKRLAVIDEQLATAAPIKRVQLVQERLDLTDELANLTASEPDLTALQTAFIEHAWGYSESKGISKAAWREVGVPANVLREAGF